ncbi:hypothetical protein MO973_19830 [Paenibacillus sp. TRM 82003]|nr:hypothetical protein [Paenibacillus sp. TRM 82003]
MIKINGQEVVISKGSLSIDDVIEERSVASFTVIDDTGTRHYKKGEPVEIFEDGELIFAGVIDTPKERKASLSGDMYHDITCADWHYLADKRIIGHPYAMELAGTIVTHIVNNFLAAEGVSIGNVQSGPIINEAKFNYIPVSDALNSIAEKTGYWWMIDQYKQLHFVARSTNEAPFPVSNSDMEKESIEVQHGNPQYRNRQYIKGGRDVTDPQTENKVGDGESKSFVVGFPIAKVPTIEISRNGGAWSPQTVGIKGLDEDKQWYWSKGDNTVVQADTETVLSKDIDRMRITYQGEFDIVVITENPEEVERLKAVEGGGSGWVEDVADEPQTTTREAAFQSANSKLKKYGVHGRTLRFRTWKGGLEVGQLLTVNLPEHDLNIAEMLIDSVTITKEDNQLWYSVSAVEGPVTGSWAKMFYTMATRGQAFVIRENISESQVLIVLAQFNKVWQESESPNIFKEIYASDTLYPSTTLFPMFDFTHRVREVALLSSDNNVILRKPITKLVNLSESTINTTVYVAPFEGNGNIAKVAFYGGYRNDIKVDEQVYLKNKIQLEAIQIDRTDTRNFTPMTGTKKLTPAYFQGLDDRIEALLARTV